MIFNHNIGLMKKVFGRKIVTDDKDYEVLPFYGYGTNGWHYYLNHGVNAGDNWIDKAFTEGHNHLSLYGYFPVIKGVLCQNTQNNQ